MKMVPYDSKKLGDIRSYSTENVRFLEEFVNSDLDCVEVVNYKHRDAKSCFSSFYKSIRRSRIGGIKCMMRQGRVFLVKTSALE